MEKCVFSKHLQEFNFTQLARGLKSIGINGVDLTVRPKGHVEPAEVADKLPEAAEALKREGVKITMITTAITSVEEPHARKVVETAASLGVRYFKFGYFSYEGFGTLAKGLREANARLRKLGELNRELGIWGGCHNHCGAALGATVSHMNRMLEGVDPEGAGVFFDVAHASIEGASYGWMEMLDDVASRVRMIALKDFALQLKEGENWGKVVPMGTGLVQWKQYIECLKRIAPQIGVMCYHGEFDAPAKEVLALVKADKEFFESLWPEAGR